jgi:hypothetical protein
MKLEQTQGLLSVDKVLYAYASAATVGTPINVSCFGAIVPIASYGATVPGEYYRFGRFRANISTGITISQGDAVYYITATGFVTNALEGGNFLIGMAVEAGSAIGTSTAPGPYVLVDLNSFSSFPTTLNAAISTTNTAALGATTITGASTVTGTFAVTGATQVTGVFTQIGALNVTGAITASTNVLATGKVTAIGGRVFQKFTVSTLNTTGTISAANLVGGLITSTSAAVVAATLPAAADVLALVPGAIVGTSFDFLICNAAGANTVTVTASATITNALGVAGDMAVTATSNVRYRLIFTNVGSGTEAAVIYKA